MHRIGAIVISVTVGVAVVSPIFRDPPRDSYPLSNYPMFSHRLEAVADVHTARGVTPDGEHRLLTPLLISDSDEVMQAVQDVGDAVAEGTTERLCAEIAGRLAAGDSDLVRVEVVTEVHDSIAYFRGERDPIAVRVWSSCEVPS